MSYLYNTIKVRRDTFATLKEILLNHSNFSDIALSTLPKSNLIEALYYILDVIYEVERKHQAICDLNKQKQNLSSSYTTQIFHKESEATREKFIIPSVINVISSLMIIAAIIFSMSVQRWSWWTTLGPALWLISKIYFNFNPSKEGLRHYARLMREATQLKNELAQKSKNLNKKKNILEADLRDYLALDEIVWALDALNKKYMDKGIIKKLIEYLEEGRAYNLKEAINLFIDEQHKAMILVKQEEAVRLERARYSLQLESKRLAEEHIRIARENSAKLDDIKMQQWLDSLH